MLYELHLNKAVIYFFYKKQVLEKLKAIICNIL